MDENLHAAMLKEYGEVSNNFRTLTDIRFQLLAFLPAASAAATALKGEFSGLSNVAFSLFGLAITVGLLIYNTRNDQLYGELVGRASEIERLLGLKGGMFANRPRDWLTIQFVGLKLPINHGNGITTIYAATCALWLQQVFLAILQTILPLRFWGNKVLEVLNLKLDQLQFLLSILLALLSVCVAWYVISHQIERRRKDMRKFARRAMECLRNLKYNTAANDDCFIEACAELAGTQPVSLKSTISSLGSLDAKSLGYYFPQVPRDLANAHFIALITGLPPRWILDVTKRQL